MLDHFSNWCQKSC